MALFQNAVLNKYLKLQDQQVVEKAYKKFGKCFHNATIQQNIRDSKEEQFQESFLSEHFVKVLGYTLNPEPDFNLTTELKNEKGAKKDDKMVWKEVFETKKAEVQNLKAENDKTDKEIDRMVYELYRLNEDEIKIVKGN